MTDLLTPCSSCRRHIRAGEEYCPFCGRASAHGCGPGPCEPGASRRKLISRAAIAGLGTLSGLAACTEPVGVTPVYGAPGGEWHEPATGGESNPDPMTTGGAPLSEDGGAGGVATEGGAGGEQSR